MDPSGDAQDVSNNDDDVTGKPEHRGKGEPDQYAEAEEHNHSTTEVGLFDAALEDRTNSGEGNTIREATQLHAPRHGPNRTSLDTLQIWPESLTFQKGSASGADHVPLPLSRVSSLISSDLQERRRLPPGRSLEQLMLRPEDVALPRDVRNRSKREQNPAAPPFWSSTEPNRSKKKSKKAFPPPQEPDVAEEVLAYRANINRLDSHFPNFSNVAAPETRHDWSPRIVMYDRLDSIQPLQRQEPWKSRGTAPPFEEFHKTLRSVSDDCSQRIILIEDLTPSLINLLGATFHIPPHVFEEHLDRSGYKTVTESRNKSESWHTHSSAQGYSSITWYRPVLPLVPITSRFRAKLVKNQKPSVRCIFDGCRTHNLRLRTSANIWRHQLELCPEPGVYYKDSRTEYPLGWEERATIWTRNIDGCKFIIFFLDPLPVVVDDSTTTGPLQPRRQPPTIANIWIRREERSSKSRKARVERSALHSRHVHDWIPPLPPGDDITVLPPPPPSPPPPPPLPPTASKTQRPLLPTGSKDSAAATTSVPHRPVTLPVDQSLPQTTGAEVADREGDLLPAALRRRATKTMMDQVSRSSDEVDARLRTDRPQKPSVTVIRGVHPDKPPPPPGVLVLNGSKDSLTVETHGPFVPYHPIRTRASSSMPSGDKFTSLQIRAYIESLQVPTSTLDEFEYMLQLPSKGKDTALDPFRALFRAIHDDSLSLVEVIRVSLKRVREGTLDEDLMQRRVTFWRSLLHKLNFSIAKIDQQLREFLQVAYEFETDALSSDRHNELPSVMLAKNIQQTLRSCMDLIDKSSDSLRAEMQIVDSRRSIAEAESVSKLTELAFVFIPLSFVASLFSMQVHELSEGVPLYQFVLVAMAFVLVAYAVRLSIRSSHLIERKNRTFNQIREHAQLQHNEPIPTHAFLAWLGSTSIRAVFRITRNIIAVCAPLILVLAVIAAILSPIILLWLRDINNGFSAVITCLLLLLDVVLVYPIMVNTSGEIDFDPKAIWREIKRNRRLNRKKRLKVLKKRRQRKFGFDPESQEVDVDDSSDSDESGDGSDEY